MYKSNPREIMLAEAEDMVYGPIGLGVRSVGEYADGFRKDAINAGLIRVMSPVIEAAEIFLREAGKRGLGIALTSVATVGSGVFKISNILKGIGASKTAARRAKNSKRGAARAQTGIDLLEKAFNNLAAQVTRLKIPIADAPSGGYYGNLISRVQQLGVNPSNKHKRKYRQIINGTALLMNQLASQLGSIAAKVEAAAAPPPPPSGPILAPLPREMISPPPPPTAIVTPAAPPVTRPVTAPAAPPEKKGVEKYLVPAGIAYAAIKLLPLLL